jgi:hypothetical protein
VHNVDQILKLRLKNSEERYERIKQKELNRDYHLSEADLDEKNLQDNLIGTQIVLGINLFSTLNWRDGFDQSQPNEPKQHHKALPPLAKKA